jgi:hypothetical protein
MLRAAGRRSDYCLACFNGDYFAGRPANFTKQILETSGAEKRG